MTAPPPLRGGLISLPTTPRIPCLLNWVMNSLNAETLQRFFKAMPVPRGSALHTVIQHRQKALPVRLTTPWADNTFPSTMELSTCRLPEQTARSQPREALSKHGLGTNPFVGLHICSGPPPFFMLQEGEDLRINHQYPPPPGDARLPCCPASSQRRGVISFSALCPPTPRQGRCSTNFR